MKRYICMMLIISLCVIGCARDAEEKVRPELVVTNDDAVAVFGTLTEGEKVEFGKYEQDNILENGKEAIEWIVVDVQPEKALLVSKKGLDCKPYNDIEEPITWENCTLRTWLNDDFINDAFEVEERRGILNSLIVNNDNAEFGTDGGYDTIDKVFLLSSDEVETYFSEMETWYGQLGNGEESIISYNIDCAVVPTAYATSQGAQADPFYFLNFEKTGYWWLRTPGYDGMSNDKGYFYTMCITNLAKTDAFGAIVNLDWMMIRPAIWVKINNN